MTLRDEWKQKLQDRQNTDSAALTAQQEERGRRWAADIIARIPAAMREAADAGKSEFEVGAFLLEELPTTGDKTLGEYYPTREQLKGGARLVYDYVIKEGLALYVGGEFKVMHLGHFPPFEVIVKFQQD